MLNSIVNLIEVQDNIVNEHGNFSTSAKSSSSQRIKTGCKRRYNEDNSTITRSNSATSTITKLKKVKKSTRKRCKYDWALIPDDEHFDPKQFNEANITDSKLNKEL